MEYLWSSPQVQWLSNFLNSWQQHKSQHQWKYSAVAVEILPTVLEELHFWWAAFLCNIVILDHISFSSICSNQLCPCSSCSRIVKGTLVLFQRAYSFKHVPAVVGICYILTNMVSYSFPKQFELFVILLVNRLIDDRKEVPSRDLLLFKSWRNWYLSRDICST